MKRFGKSARSVTLENMKFKCDPIFKCEMTVFL